MMSGKFREYNWNDIKRLILADAGLLTEEDQRTKGEIWYTGNFNEPGHLTDTCIGVQVYDKPFGERIKEHAGDV